MCGDDPVLCGLFPNVVIDTQRLTYTTHPRQPALDAAMGQEAQGRCFVRPSGTEDVVRIYAGGCRCGWVNSYIYIYIHTVCGGCVV